MWRGIVQGYIHSIRNHYEPMVREVQNKEMKQSVEVKIENEEETSEEEEQKYQLIIHESSKEDEASMVCEESIKDEQPIVWDIPTPTSDGTNYGDEDASVPTEEECPLDLTMKDKKQQSETQHIPLLTERRKTVLDPKEHGGLILTKEENEYDKQNPIIDDTTVVTIKSGKPFPTWLYENINA